MVPLPTCMPVLSTWQHGRTASRGSTTAQVLRLEYLEEESKEVAADRDAAREEAALARAEASACREETAAARSEAARARLAAAAAQARADAAEQLPPATQLVRSFLSPLLSTAFPAAEISVVTMMREADLPSESSPYLP